MNYSKLLEGKTAVVTNVATIADYDVGAAIVRLFAEHGASVAVGVKNVLVGEKLMSEIRGISPDSFYWACDLCDPGSVEAFCAEVNSRWKLVNVLVNNPWLEGGGDLESTDDSDDDVILQAYQRSIMQTLRAFWPAMIKNGHCSVINISSSAVFKPASGQLAFAMANGAVGGMTRVPAVEGGIYEVRVNEILAGQGVNRSSEAYHPLAAVSCSSNGDDNKRSESSETGRTDCSGENSRADIVGVARAALFLASDMASYVSGASISVSGGIRRAMPV